MFTSQLNFKNGYPNLIEITEPVGMDGEVFTIETELFAPDLEFGNQEASLVFWNGVFEEGQTSLNLPNGTLVYKMKTMGFDWLVEYNKRYGTEAVVERIILKDGVPFVIGELDFESMEVYANYVSCKVVLNGQRSAMRDEADTQLDMYSLKDLAGNAITPLAPSKILTKALPIEAESTWRQTETALLFAGYHSYFNVARQNAGGIKSSLVPFDPYDDLFWSFQTAVNNFRYVRAKNDLSNVKLTVNLDYTFFYRFTTGGGYDPESFIRGIVIISPEPFSGSEFSNNAIYQNVFYQKTISDGINQDFTYKDVIQLDLPDVPRDYCIHVFWDVHYDTGHLGTTDAEGAPFSDFLAFFLSPETGLREYLDHLDSGTGAYHDRTAWNIVDQTFTISASATGINSVANGLRWTDCLHQSALQISGLPVNDPRWANGGEHYNNFRINGWGMRGFDNKPFLETWGNLKKGLLEVAGDVMINRDNIFIGEYSDFFQNIEIGVLDELPSEDSKDVKDTRYTLKLFEYAYNKYETNDKDTDEFVRNTNAGIHTELQDRLPSRRNKNQLKIDIPHVRDPFAGEIARAQSVFAKPETSLSTDDDIFMYEVVELAPNTRATFGAKLLVRNNGNFTITILNQSSGGDPIFGWTTLGMSVGDIINISGSLNGIFQQWAIQSFTVSSITLIAQPGTVIDFEGDLYLVFDYAYSGVQYVIRTNENVYSEGLPTPERFGNQAYNPRQNIEKWGPFLHTAGYYNQNGGIITNTMYKNNGLAKIQVLPNGVLHQMNEDMPISSMKSAILHPEMLNTKMQASFEYILSILEKLALYRGFVRVRGIDGRISKRHFRTLKYGWFVETLQAEMWKRIDSDGASVVSVAGGGYLINGAFYNVAPDWFEINNGYLSIFDANRIDLFTPEYFAKVSLDGVNYTDENAFRNALIQLLA